MDLEATRDEILFEVHQQQVEQGIEFSESEVKAEIHYAFSWIRFIGCFD